MTYGFGMNDSTLVQNIGEYIAAGDTKAALRVIGREFHSRRWSLGTSSNYSVITHRNPIELLITASGKDKSSLTENDFVTVDAAGNLLDTEQAAGKKSSAETLLHLLGLPLAECHYSILWPARNFCISSTSLICLASAGMVTMAMERLLFSLEYLCR